MKALFILFAIAASSVVAAVGFAAVRKHLRFRRYLSVLREQHKLVGELVARLQTDLQHDYAASETILRSRQDRQLLSDAQDINVRLIGRAIRALATADAHLKKRRQKQAVEEIRIAQGHLARVNQRGEQLRLARIKAGETAEEARRSLSSARWRFDSALRAFRALRVSGHPLDPDIALREAGNLLSAAEQELAGDGDPARALEFSSQVRGAIERSDANVRRVIARHEEIASVLVALPKRLGLIQRSVQSARNDIVRLHARNPELAEQLLARIDGIDNRLAESERLRRDCVRRNDSYDVDAAGPAMKALLASVKEIEAAAAAPAMALAQHKMVDNLQTKVSRRQETLTHLLVQGMLSDEAAEALEEAQRRLESVAVVRERANPLEQAALLRAALIKFDEAADMAIPEIVRGQIIN
ncbi:hypothetical protein HY633_03715 [Candidatus Uhrbacteria bacterium]|nr:hypothetical protein [Candidatus Uhrbacteria bacterium]